MEIGLRNVLILSVAFLIYITTSSTMSNIEKTVTNSITKEDPSFQGDGYYCQCISYASFAFFNWLAPSVINIIGIKISLCTNCIIYITFCLQFIFPTTLGAYISCAAVGFGGAVMWPAQGNYLTLNSTPYTITRNSGLFYTILDFGGLTGNLFVMYVFSGKEKIDKSTRLYLMLSFAAIEVVALIAFALLPKSKQSVSDKVKENKHDGPVKSFLESIKLFFTPIMLLLSLTSVYRGLELGFCSGVYSSCLGFTKKFDNRKKLVGTSGLIMNGGGLLCGGIFSAFGVKIAKWGKNYVIVIGCFIHMLAFCLIFVNLPNDSTFSDTDSDAIISSNVYLALFCSFLLGVVNSIYNNMITSTLGTIYADNSVPAFAIFQFCTAVGSIIIFATAQLLGLYYQLAILAFVAIIGTVSFIKVELVHKKRISEALKNQTNKMSSVAA